MGQLRILVLMRMVRDVVEELVIAPHGRSLDGEALQLIANETAEQALEEALILKERYGGEVTVVGMERPGVRGTLAGAIAKGADRVVLLTEVPVMPTTREAAGYMAASISSIDGLLPADLVLIGCQAINDLDGHLAPLVAHHLKMPYLSLVTGVEAGDGDKATVVKEFAGGMRGRFEIDLPAVLGIQAAENPLRYVPVAKLRAAMDSGLIEEIAAAAPGDFDRVPVASMAAPEGTDHAEMLASDPGEAARQIFDILAARGLLKEDGHVG